MEIKVSYVQARRFIDFHTLILNSYFETVKNGGLGYEWIGFGRRNISPDI